MADPDITTERLRSSGYQNVELTSVDEPVFLGSDADDAYSFVSTLGITRGLTADLDEATRTAALDQLHRTLEDHETADGVTFEGSAWLITATHSELLTEHADQSEARFLSADSTGSVLALDHEVRAADRPGQLRLLPRELERAELGGDLHPFGELEPDRSLLRFVERYSTLIDSPLS